MVDVVHLIKVVYLMVMVHLVDVIHLVVVAHLIEVTTWLTWYTWLTWWFTQLTWCTWLSWCSFYPSEIVVIVWSESFRVIQVSSRCSCNPSDLTVLVRSEWDRGDRVIPRVRSEWSRVDDWWSYGQTVLVRFEWGRGVRMIRMSSYWSWDPSELVMFVWSDWVRDVHVCYCWYISHRCVTMVQFYLRSIEHKSQMCHDDPSFLLFVAHVLQLVSCHTIRYSYSSCRDKQFGDRTFCVVSHIFLCFISHGCVTMIVIQI